MKIAYVINQYPKVSHSFIRREILALERKGVELQRIAMRGWNEKVPDAQDRAEAAKTQYVLQQGAIGLLVALLIALISTPTRFVSALLLASRMSRGSDRSLAFHWIYFAEACVVARWVKTSGARHLHAHFGTNAAEVAMLAGLIAGLPFSFTVHGPEEFDRPQALGLPEKIRRAKFVVGISSFGRSQLYRWVDHGHWPKIQVVHCGLDAEFLQGESAAASDSVDLVCVGRLCEQKGQLLLLAALRRVLASGTNCTLVLAGDGEFREAIETQAKALNISRHIRITGWISGDEVRTEINRARALVLPSFAEGLPVVLMEAMALSKPVLSTYVAGIPELVIDGQTGWLFPAGDVEQLALAMQRCLDTSGEQLDAMGRAAHTRVLARHNIDDCATLLADLFANGPRG